MQSKADYKAESMLADRPYYYPLTIGDNGTLSILREKSGRSLRIVGQ